jgi:hypothetical protein
MPNGVQCAGCVGNRTIADVTKVEELKRSFRVASDPEAFIRRHSGLPGPRGNLELAQAVADEGDERLFRRLTGWGPDRAPANTPEEFLTVCGVVGLGRLVAEGRVDLVPALRAFASDPRWRTREAVAMALQRWAASIFAACSPRCAGPGGTATSSGPWWPRCASLRFCVIRRPPIG